VRCFADSRLSLCPFPSCHCVVCPSSIYLFWLLLWYLQTLPTKKHESITPLVWCGEWSIYDLIWSIVFNATLRNISAISWWPVLVVEEAGVPGENHRPWASNW
jgi:hypothetical protein